MRAPAELRAVADLAARAIAAAGLDLSGQRLAVAVSGGADSLAALHALRTLAGPRGFELAVVTVDHGLRPGAAADAAFVAEHADGIGVPVIVTVADQATLARHAGEGPEAAARAARYEALAAAADQLGCRWLATGHTLDDQAETVLLALLRGTGPDGLAGMATVSGRLLRPLLAVRRAQTEAVCAAIGVSARQDETNGDERLLRNAVRRRLLPLLEELRPGATATLARGAALARDDRTWANAAAADALAGLRVGEGVPAAALAGLPAGLGRRVVRAAAAQAGLAVPPAAAVDRVLAMAAAAPGLAVGPVTWPGARVERRGELLTWAPGPG